MRGPVGTSHLKNVAQIQRADLPLREKLERLLHAAAELEHALLLEYLYAGYTVKRPGADDLTPEQEVVLNGWRTNLFLIARQEMEHLGMVNNMLNAIGVKPTFERPAFPVPADQMPEGLPLELRRLDHAALETFILWERPRAPDAAEAVEASPRLRGAAPLLRGAGRRAPTDYTIYTLYMEVLDAFDKLTEGGRKDKEFFTGDPAAQFGMSDPNETVMIQTVASFQDVQSAVFQILEEGEGLPFAREPMPVTHFERYVHMMGQYEAFQREGFEPFRRVVANPTVADEEEVRPGTSPITDRATREVAILSDLAYQNMVWALRRFYANADAPDARNALGYLAFMPMMTMTIRPLAEILTELPATDDPGGGFAGPPFTPPPAPPEAAAEFWSRFTANMTKAADDAARIARQNACAHGGVPACKDRACAAYARLAFVAENMRLMNKRAAQPMPPVV